MGEHDNNGYHVRFANENDAEDILEITKIAFQKYAKDANIETIAALHETVDDILLDLQSKVVLVAFFAGKVIGSVRISVDGENAYLSRFGVSDEYQNLGIGKSLMNLVDIEMKSRGVKNLTLHTASKVKSLVVFYYKRGFYISSTENSRGYIRAELKKEY